MTSSWVGPKQKSRWWRSLIFSICGPNTAQRPVSSHTSAGCTAGISSSIAPARFISSRTTASTRRSTRRPSGIQVYNPDPRRLMRPARSISLWLTSSASDGASLVVEMKYWVARMVDNRDKTRILTCVRVIFRARFWSGMAMRLRFGKHRAVDEGLEVTEERGVRTLHLGSQAIQSAMRVNRPWDLELAYTRAMMGFLMFNPIDRKSTRLNSSHQKISYAVF